MLKRKNDRQPPQRLEEERYPNDYWLDEEDGGEDISEPADSSKPVSGRLHSEPMVVKKRMNWISVREGVSISMKKGKQNIRSKVPKKPYIVENLYWMRSQNKI